MTIIRPQARVALIRHMSDSPNDRVCHYFRNNGIDTVEFNPARGVPLNQPLSAFDATVVYGGIQSVNDASLTYLQSEIQWLRESVQQDHPLLCICLGAQLLTLALGGTVGRHKDGLHEIGFHEIDPTPQGQTFFSKTRHFFQWHNEGCHPPDDTVVLATGSQFQTQAFRVSERQFAVQFHPEVTPPIMASWLSEVDDVEQRPGAHKLVRQHHDAQQYETPISAWMGDFLEAWTQRW